VTSLPEITIEEAATDTVYFERSEPWVSNARVTLGEEFFSHGHATSFGLQDATATVRNFRLRDVHLDTAAMTLIKDGKRIRETHYLAPDEWYANAHVAEDNRIILEQSVDYVMAREFGNYYHWLVQTIPTIDWTLRDRSTSNIVLLSGHLAGWEEELLALLGHDRVPRIALHPAHHYWIPRLEYSEFQNGSTAFKISRSAQSTFGRLLEVAANAEPAVADIIYVARTDSSNRVAENEDEVMALLRSEGIQMVVPGNLSVADQINLFHKADAIIGPHGAGLTNVVFCKPGTVFYELLPSHYVNSCFNRLAQAAGLDYAADIFESHNHGDGNPHAGRWTLDPELILRRVREIKNYLLTGRTRPVFQVSATIAEFLDASWYLARYPDVAASGCDPLQHYVHFGASEERDPNRYFDNAWYKTQYEDVAASGMNPLLHYLQIGAAEMRNPHPHFDAAFYVDQHPEAAANPLLYHVRLGAARGWPTEKPRNTTPAGALTLIEAAVSEAPGAHPEWGTLRQWQSDEIALALTPIAFLAFVDLEFPPDERAHRFATELSVALSAAGSRVR
jgi:Glycosyltransferase 61